MRIYIAGQMSGLPDFNRAAFNEIAKKLNALGHVVINPAILPNGLEQHQYMDICFAMIRAADSLYLMANWTNSKGAMAEYYYAEKLGLAFEYEPEKLGLAFEYVPEKWG